MKKYTMSEIRQANLAKGFHTFESKTLKFFGETMRNWRAGTMLSDGRQVVYRKGGKAGDATFLFDPKTGSVNKRRDGDPV